MKLLFETVSGKKVLKEFKNGTLAKNFIMKNKDKYISTIYALIWETEKELNNNSNNLDTTMIKLINEHHI